jgi:hypothetical protein
MTILAIKDGLKNRMETIPALEGKVYTYIPGTQEPPSVTIVPGTFVPGDTKAAITYSRNFGGTNHDYVFTLAVVVSFTVDHQAAADLDSFLSPHGANSIKAAIEAEDTLGGVASYAHVDRVIQYGALEWNGLKFFGAQIIVEVNGA